MVKSYGIGLEAAEGESADSAVVAIGKGTETGVEGRDGLFDHHLLESIEIEEIGTGCRIGVSQNGSTAFHHDYHRDALLGCDEVVHDVAQHSLGAPSCLILSGSVHEIEHGEAPFGLGGILGRKIDIARPLRPCQLGVVFLDTDLAVRDFLLKIEIHPGLGHLDTAGPVSGTEEFLGIGIGNPLSVDSEHIVVESGNKRVGSHFPNPIFALGHGIGLADID